MSNTVHLICWDDLPGEDLHRGPVRAHFTDLGSAAGSFSTGLRRIQVESGAQSSPAHVHGAEEEIFFVLDGSGFSWQNGETFEVAAGDCLVHLPGGAGGDALVHVQGGEAHTLVAGGAGLDVLAYGARLPDDACFLPRSKVAWLGPAWVDAGHDDDPYDREAATGPVELTSPSSRPSRIQNVDQVAGDHFDREDVKMLCRDLGEAAGSIRLGLQHIAVAPLGCSGLPHCHSCEEELFIVLHGDGSCLLGDEQFSVHRGSVLARPAGTGVAHSFHAGTGGLVLLAFGQRNPADYVFYPRSGTIYFKAAKLHAQLEPVDLWTVEQARRD